MSFSTNSYQHCYLFWFRSVLSQDALAFEAQIGERAVSRIEAGETYPRFTTLEKIAKTLGIELKNLIEFDK